MSEYGTPEYWQEIEEAKRAADNGQSRPHTMNYEALQAHDDQRSRQGYGLSGVLLGAAAAAGSKDSSVNPSSGCTSSDFTSAVLRAMVSEDSALYYLICKTSIPVCSEVEIYQIGIKNTFSQSDILSFTAFFANKEVHPVSLPPLVGKLFEMDGTSRDISSSAVDLEGQEKKKAFVPTNTSYRNVDYVLFTSLGKKGDPDFFPIEPPIRIRKPRGLRDLIRLKGWTITRDYDISPPSGPK